MPKNKQKRGRRPLNRQKPRMPGPTKAITAVWNTLSQAKPQYSHNLVADNKIHKFVQTIDYGNVVTTSAGSTVYFPKSFTFSDLAQASNFTALFDQYRIDSIELWVQPVGATPQATSVPWVLVVDYDDDNTPSSIASLLQYTNCIDQNIPSACYVHFKPHVAVSAYTGAFGGFKNEVASWMDSGSPGIRHYGVKIAVSSSTVTYTMQMVGRMHISCRNVF